MSLVQDRITGVSTVRCFFVFLGRAEMQVSNKDKSSAPMEDK